MQFIGVMWAIQLEFLLTWPISNEPSKDFTLEAMRLLLFFFLFYLSFMYFSNKYNSLVYVVSCYVVVLLVGK